MEEGAPIADPRDGKFGFPLWRHRDRQDCR